MSLFDGMITGASGNPSTQGGFAFPSSLSEKYRPQSLADFVGLDKPKKVLSKFADAPFPTAFLFVGPSGTGKTTMALALCAALRAELQHIPSQACSVANVEDVVRRCHYVPHDGGFHFVLADEADQMSPAAQLSFLSKLDATCFPPSTIFVFTANDTERLQPRFLSRCMTLNFSSHGMSTDAAALLATIWQKEAPDAPAPNFARIVKDSANNLRDAVNSLQVELLAV